MVQTQMATSTEAEGDVAVEVPPEMESELVNSPMPEGENDIPSEEVQDEPIEKEEVQEVPQSEPELSPREEKRVSKLIPKLKEESAKRKQLEDENSALKEMLQGFKPGQNQSILGQQPFTPPWEQNQAPLIQPNENGEVSPEDFQRAVVQTADQITSVKLAQFQSTLARYENLKEDTAYIQKTYSPSQEDEKTIVDLYKKASDGNPNLGLREFAEPILKRIQAGQATGRQEITPKLLKQEAEGAVPPSASGAKKSGTFDPDNASQEEMEAYLKANGLWDEA